MWRIFLLAGLLHVVGVMSRPMEALDGRLWAIDDEIIIRPRNTIEDMVRQRLISPTINEEDERYELFSQNPQEKRGFTMLARWAPFSNIGKQRSSIREHNNRISNMEIVSADARAPPRQTGQPLRWG